MLSIRRRNDDYLYRYLQNKRTGNVSNTSNSKKVIWLQTTVFVFVIGIVICLQLRLSITEGYHLPCTDLLGDKDNFINLPSLHRRDTNTNRNYYYTTHQLFNHSFDPTAADVDSEVPEHYWSARDIKKFLPSISLNSDVQHPPLVYFITPTYKNPAQWVNLVRLSQTLMNDRLVYWIVVEDAHECSLRVRKQLEFSGLMYAHFAMKTPPKIEGGKGIEQRNKALEHLEQFGGPDGVVYFGDDDNAYDLRLFREIRQTRRISVFTTGFVGSNGMYERCIVNEETGKVKKTVTNFQPHSRKFPIDMGAFAVHTSILRERKPRFRFECCGKLETLFLEQIAENLSDLEPLNDNCTKFYSWHLKTGGIQTGVVGGDPDFNEIKKLV